MELRLEDFNHICGESQKIKSEWNKKVFPFTQKYLDEGFKDREWFSVREPDISDLPIAVIALMESPEISETLHVTALEVAQPIRSKGFGSAVMKLLSQTARDNGYKLITLRMATPDLIDFYSPLGFNHWYDDYLIKTL